MKTHPLTRAAAGAAASLAVLVPLAGCSTEDSRATAAPSQQSTSSPSASTSASESTEVQAAGYTDGTYTARGYYGGAPSYMSFTVTLDDGRITDVESGLMPDNNETSRGYQERFAAALPDEVIGKSVDDVEVGVLAGSSSCGDGFNDALAKIRDQAATNS